LLMSVPLAIEYEAVCRRPEHRVAAELTVREVGIFLDAILAMGNLVKVHFLWRPQLRDPNDEMVLEAAVNGGADALVTFNMRDYGDTPARFGVALLLPRDTIGRIKS
jgi:predicted nucleic acid-binding protein